MNKVFWGAVVVVFGLMLWSWQPWFDIGGGFDEQQCLERVRAGKLLDSDCSAYWAQIAAR